MHVALEITEQRGNLAMLAKETSTAIQNLTSSVNAMQGDLRHLSTQLGDVARLQQEHISHSEGLGRAFVAIEKLADEFSGWRKSHEQDNRVVSDRVTIFRGALIGFSLVSALLVSVGVWAYQRDEQVSAVERKRIEQEMAEKFAEFDGRVDYIEGQIREMQMTRKLK